MEDHHADVLLRGGSVVDGMGGPPQSADVAVRDGRIASSGALGSWSADRVLEVTGLVVAPGFIDMHTHSDLSLLLNPRAESKLRQGVTTEVIGQCGFSPAPTPEGREDAIRPMFGRWGQIVRWQWGSFGDYLRAFRESGCSVNIVPVVGHSTVRAAVMGVENRRPTAGELARMRGAVVEALADGAFGMSTGLVYSPGMFADTEELAALSAAVSEAGGIYFTHIRGEAETLLEAVREAVEIGRRSGAPVQVSHLKAEGRSNWGKLADALELIDAARTDGLDIAFDVYPYTAWNTGLAQLLPRWAREGDAQAMMHRLADPALKARTAREMAQEAAADPGRWERRLIASVESARHRALQGLTIAEIARRTGESPEDAVITILREEQGNVSMVGFGMCEDDVRRALAHPLAMIGSDSASTAPYGVLGEGHPHPRTYGTFARVLGHYCRKEGLFGLGEAVAKMTGRAADRLGLTERGRIAPGMAADLVVFDPGAIADRSTYQKPHQYADGVRLVLVNGVVELEGDDHQERFPGQVIQRPEGRTKAPSRESEHRR